MSVSERAGCITSIGTGRTNCNPLAHEFSHFGCPLQGMTYVSIQNNCGRAETDTPSACEFEKVKALFLRPCCAANRGENVTMNERLEQSTVEAKNAGKDLEKLVGELQELKQGLKAARQAAEAAKVAKSRFLAN